MKKEEEDGKWREKTIRVGMKGKEVAEGSVIDGRKMDED